MTEPAIKDLLDVLAFERDGRLAHARAADDIAATLDLMHNDMAEWFLAADKGIPIPAKAIVDMRRRVQATIDAAVQLGLENLESCKALAKRIGPPTPDGEPPEDLADTRPEGIPLDEIARANYED